MNDVIVPGKVQPEMFWKAYKSKLLQIASSAAKQAYRSDFEWTPYAMNAAMRAVESLGLVPQGEYFRLDAIGYERHGRTIGHFAWHLSTRTEIIGPMSFANSATSWLIYEFLYPIGISKRTGTSKLASRAISRNLRVGL